MTAAEVRKRLSRYLPVARTCGGNGHRLPDRLVTCRSSSCLRLRARGRTHPQPLLDGLYPFLVTAAAGAAAVVLVLAAFAAWRDTPRGALDRFWGPLLNSPSPVLVCIGDPYSASVRPPGSPAEDGVAGTAGDVTIDEFLLSNSVRYTDAVALSLLTGELRARTKAFRIRRPAATELKDLREGPVILIGGFNNPWTLKLNDGLRFTLTSEQNGSYIRDRDRPDSREWQSRTRSTRMKDVAQTYGLITRAEDPATGSHGGHGIGSRAGHACRRRVRDRRVLSRDGGAATIRRAEPAEPADCRGCCRHR